MAEKENIEELLKNTVVQNLPSDKLAEISRVMQRKVLQQNEILFNEGDPADAFYIVASGEVRVFVKHEPGIERELSVVGPGGHFGEVALLTGETRTASVDATTETLLLVLLKEDFERLVKEFPELSRIFMKDMRKWLLEDQVIIAEEADAVLKRSRLSWIDFVLVLGVSILLAVSFNFSNPNGIPLIPTPPDRASVPVISPQEAMEKSRQGNVLILDATPANFYQKGHIQGSVNMPIALFDIVYMMNFPDESKEREILVYGSTISKPYDLEIAGKLLLRGHTDVKIIDGGLPAWMAKGYPVEEKAAK
ncbi:MAG: cyclic nucleotide-binding domain-containing protein [Syntrophobacteraceae bacterium]